jgi:hypothetical protein
LKIDQLTLKSHPQTLNFVILIPLSTIFNFLLFVQKLGYDKQEGTKRRFFLVEIERKEQKTEMKKKKEEPGGKT